MSQVATAKCEELTHLKWFIKMDWKYPAVGNKLKQGEVFNKYQSERHNLQYIDGCIYKINDKDIVQEGKSAGKRRLLWVVPVDMRWGIIQAAHDGPDAGHSSYRPTLMRVRETMWWPRMATDIKVYTDACDACQRAKRGQDPPQPERRPLLHRLPNSEITIDVVEGMVLAANGWRYVVCIVDSSSRYLEYYGCKSNDAESIADALVHWICNGRGFPRVIKHCQDKSIINAMILTLLQRLQIGSKTQNAYSPQLIGVNERPHKELGNQLRIHTQSDPKMWHLMLPWAQYVHNTSVHSVTGCTPLYLEMGNPKETMVEVAHLPELMSEQDVKEVALERVRFYYELSFQ